MPLFRIAFCLAALQLLMFAGCGGRKPDVPTPTAATPEQKETEKEAKHPVADRTESAPPKPKPDSAAAAVERTLQALEKGQLAEAYDFLPPSYQSDIDGLVHEFAQQMDEDVWSKMNTIVRKLVTVLKDKKDFILAMDFFRDQPGIATVKKQWDDQVAMLTELLESEVTDLEKLKQMTARSLLTKSTSPALQHLDALGKAIGADLSRQFAGVTVTSGTGSDADQVVSLKGPLDEKPVDIAYVKHDGHWLPKTLVDNWQSGIAADRAWLKRFPERIRTIKPQIIEAASRADDILDRLLAATNREEFQVAAGPAILAFAAEWPKLQRMFHQAVATTSETQNVTILITPELTEKEQTRLVNAVFKPLVEAGSDYTLYSNDGRTTCRLLRLADVDAVHADLAKHFEAAPTAISFDRERSTMTIDLAK